MLTSLKKLATQIKPTSQQVFLASEFMALYRTRNQIQLSEYLGKAHVKHQIYEVSFVHDTGS